MSRREKPWSCELRVSSWSQSCPNNVNGKPGALLWQQTTLGWLHAVLQFGNHGCRCHCWHRPTGLREEGALPVAAQLVKHHSIWWASHAKGRGWITLVKTNDLQWKFCFMAKEIGASKIFSSLVSTLWWDCRTQFFIVCVHWWVQPHQTLGQWRWNILERRCKASESLIESSLCEERLLASPGLRWLNRDKSLLVAGVLWAHWHGHPLSLLPLYPAPGAL